jgi:hypothetical protein
MIRPLAIAAVAFGSKFGGPAGALVGIAAKTGEIAYDPSNNVIQTTSGQPGTFNNSIKSAIMQSR